MSWYLEVLKKYAVFSGRARRKEYWMFTLVSVVISIVLTIVDKAVLDSSILNGLYSLAVLLPTLAVGARRLHDTGRSGWWQLIGVVPLVGWIVLIVFFASAGEQNQNAHGANPKFAPAQA
ncbi:DUF805 domain-containing protein [Streptomyces meridianus]|uniref:DUF805 domain-containing protein n=1 Tax=Streptomyces meridianus TaxID=2938945 RepID=A0ABT0XA34_9ACTN|nr:DUF805 domain-containing protein [Streptomyces meridianus]MCM2579382.1 DUF805 domain-containing protein [Streptomyces meridianus]